MTALLPPNASKLENALDAAMARIGEVPTPLATLWDPQTCPIELLPWLAWSLSIDFWDPTWPEALKRAQVANAIPTHRRKGTVASVRQLIDVYDVGMTLSEWFDQAPPADPYTFQIDLPLTGDDGEASSAAFAIRVSTEIARTKPVRAWFDFNQRLSTEGFVGVVAGAQATGYARLAVDALVQDTAGDWAGVMLTSEGEPIFTDLVAPLEISP